MFQFVVAAAILAWDKNHRGRTNVGHIFSIMTCSAGDTKAGEPTGMRRPLHDVDACWIKGGRWRIPNFFQIPFEVTVLASTLERSVHGMCHFSKRFWGWMTHVNSEMDLSWNYVARIRE